MKVPTLEENDPAESLYQQEAQFLHNFLVQSETDLEESHICGIEVTASSTIPTDVEIFIKKLHTEFDDVVLFIDIQPNPPVRGPFGYAFIPLKWDGQPTRAKVMCMHGEKLEAFKQSWKIGQKEG